MFNEEPIFYIVELFYHYSDELLCNYCMNVKVSVSSSTVSMEVSKAIVVHTTVFLQ